MQFFFYVDPPKEDIFFGNLLCPLNVADYQLTIKKEEKSETGMSTRAGCIGRPIEIGKTALTQKTCVSDSIHLWNRAPKNVTESKSLNQAKKEIKKYAKTLPI